MLWLPWEEKWQQKSAKDGKPGHREGSQDWGLAAGGVGGGEKGN